MTTDLWSLARSHRQDQMFSTLFMARSVEQQLNTDDGIDAAIAWCRQTGVTKVYIESFRGGLLATREHLTHARDRFRAAGFQVSGCVTTTGMADTAVKGKQYFPCFTYTPTQQQLQDIFEFTAPLFDEIMIDDFYCTACECDECKQARGSRSWADYRLELMNRLSAERVLGPARRVNPKVKIIIKYPMWYDVFHDRGYNPDHETSAFDRIWVGTETRDYTDQQWGGTAPYRGYWIMRWLGQIGGGKCGGGWYDQLGTHGDTYLEQARQTILGGARESVLFSYPSLLRNTGPENIEALRKEQPKLFELAAWVKGETPRGVISYKPISSPGDDDAWIADWLGMVGIPLVPAHRFPTSASTAKSAPHVAFFPVQAAHDPKFADEAARYLANGGRAIFTAHAVAAAKLVAGSKGVFILDAPKPELIPDLPAGQITALRRAALDPLGMTLEGPTWVALYLFGARKLALENFRDRPAEMRLILPDAGRYRLVLTLGREGARVTAVGGALTISLPPRTLACLVKPA